MYYSNENIEDFDRFVEFLGFSYSNSIADAPYVFINLEKFIFTGNNGVGFANHNLNSRELIDRFNRLLQELNKFDKNNPDQKQLRMLGVDLIDVKSSSDENLFRWSYYNHKFAASQGKDMEAMDKWHQLEQNIDVNKIAQFKARRESNIALYMHIIKNHMFFDDIVFAGIDPHIKNEVKFGLDIAEEQYLEKLIKENKASKVCSKAEHGLASLLLNLVKRFAKIKKLKLKAHIVSNSQKLNSNYLVMIRNIFTHLNVEESSINDCNFVFLVNDLDMLSVIPIIDTDRPVYVTDLSQSSTPNFSYLLLKDDGFDQIHAFSKKRDSERAVDSFTRSISAGVVGHIIKRKFKEQIASNYMEDYFKPLSTGIGKSIKDFQTPIELLTAKLEGVTNA